MPFGVPVRLRVRVLYCYRVRLAAKDARFSLWRHGFESRTRYFGGARTKAGEAVSHTAWEGFDSLRLHCEVLLDSAGRRILASRRLGRRGILASRSKESETGVSRLPGSHSFPCSSKVERPAVNGLVEGSSPSEGAAGLHHHGGQLHV